MPSLASRFARYALLGKPAVAPKPSTIARWTTARLPFSLFHCAASALVMIPVLHTTTELVPVESSLCSYKAMITGVPATTGLAPVECSLSSYSAAEKHRAGAG